MRLVLQTTLFYKDGRLDNVFEVDLCETGANAYVVNFRHGRRGSPLREGSKTNAPVTREQADVIFKRLVDDKRAAGYSDDPTAVSTPPAVNETDDQRAPSLAGDGSSDDPRQQAIMDRLLTGNSRGWKLSRAIWRAGLLRLPAAEAPLLALSTRDEPFVCYSIAWALGRCCKQGSSAAIHWLHGISTSTDVDESVQRVARQSLRLLMTADDRHAQQQRDLQALPEAIQTALTSGDAEAVVAALRAELQEPSAHNTRVLEDLDAIGTSLCRHALALFIEQSDFGPHIFQRLRRLYKHAEQRDDTLLFAAFARRFDLLRHRTNYANYWYGAKPTGPETAYSLQSRNYFRRRIWRHLRSLGEVGNPAYTELAAAVLAAHSPADLGQPGEIVRYTWDRGYRTIRRQFDEYHKLGIFNRILFANSDRYERGTYRWLLNDTKPETEIRPAQEAAFPDLWQAYPQPLIPLLMRTHVAAVIRFALSSLRENQAYLDQLPNETVIRLLACPHAEAAALASEIACTRYKESDPNLELLIALAHCAHEPGQQQARSWLQRHQRHWQNDVDHIHALAVGPIPTTRSWLLQQLLSVRISLSSSVLDAIIGRFIASLHALPHDKADPTGQAVAEDMVTLLTSLCAERLRDVAQSVIEELMQLEVAAAKRLAGMILANHRTLSRNPPAVIIDQLLSHETPTVREAGVAVISALSDTDLTRNPEALSVLIRSEYADIRAAIAPRVAQLIRSNSLFAQKLAEILLTELRLPGAPDGVPAATAEFLTTHLLEAVQRLSNFDPWALLRARSIPVQSVGLAVIISTSEREQFSASQLVTLGSHHLLAARQCAWAALERDHRQWLQEPEVLAQLIDCRWGDSRAQVMNFITQHDAGAELSADLLVTLCDSTKPDVQQFSCAMITQHFRDADGHTYLQKLSEHPSNNLRLFTTNYLQTYASGNAERIAQLEFYFRSVLGQVNKGRVAKERVLQFFEQEIAGSEAAAKVIVAIAHWFSASSAASMKPRLLQLLVRAQRLWPSLASPLQLTQAEVRHAG